MKVTIVGGAGRVGSNTAFVLQTWGVASDLALIDVSSEGAAGEALDLLHGAAFTAPQRWRSSSEYAVAEGSDVVVITAGLRRKPDETRLDLINRNAKLFLDILDNLRKIPLPAHCSLVVVTNPVDILTQIAYEKSGFAPERVIGLGTVLDTLRFRSLLSELFLVDSRQISALILGEHGDSMVPIWSSANVNGVPLPSMPHYDQARVQAIFERASKSGAEVIKLKGGAGYAVGVAIAEVVRAIESDSKSILPVSTMQTGLFGVKGVCLSVPTIVGKGGAERQLEMELWPKELAGLRRSADALREIWDKVKL